MREYALVLVLAMAVTYLLTPIARRLAIAAGALATVRDRDVHAGSGCLIWSVTPKQLRFIAR